MTVERGGRAAAEAELRRAFDEACAEVAAVRERLGAAAERASVAEERTRVRERAAESE